MITIYLVRHGETFLNVSRKIQGSSDSPLTETGIFQAKCVGRKLKPISFYRAYTSDLKRHKDTLRYILEEINESVEVIEDLRLREIDFGSFEGKDQTELLSAINEYLNKDDVSYQKLFETYGPTFVAGLTYKLDTDNKAENAGCAIERMKEALEEMVIDAQEGENILVVSSGSIIDVTLEQFRTQRKIQTLQNGEFIKLVYDKHKFKVEEKYNE